LNAVLARNGLPYLPHAEARNMIGGGARRMLELALKAHGRACSGAELDRLFENFVAHYSAHVADRSRPYPGVVEAMDELAARGCRLAVCTNKLEALTRLLLDALGLTVRFAAICGQDTFGVQKPNPEMLRRTVLAAGGDITQAVMVGDSHNDIDAARGAGIPVVAVDFGYTETPVAALGPDKIISHFSDLPAAIDEVCGPWRGA
jgi:phosphoglycolate phosphatase